MIRYHGTPITDNVAMVNALTGRHAMVSWRRPDQIQGVAEICDSFALDNGAYSAWRKGTPVRDWEPYLLWVTKWSRHPGFDWAIIPDVIDGSEADNDALIDWWFRQGGCHSWSVPVWHMHESLARLERLAGGFDYGPARVAIGSSGRYSKPDTDPWWDRMAEAMEVVTDSQRRPIVKLHGLRMLKPGILSHLPLASADSSMVARNHNSDRDWRGTYVPPPAIRALVLAARIDEHAVTPIWSRQRGGQHNAELLG